MSTLAKKLEHSATKAAMVAIAGMVGSVLVSNGLKEIPVFHHDVPRFIVVGGSLFVVSVATDFVVPVITPWTSYGNEQLQKFEQKCH